MSTVVKVAVVGAGPAGFFATADLLRRKELLLQVDMFDRLPTPYGLVRHGVAPDHQQIKGITERYARDAEAGGSRFRMFGNVEVGRDLSLAELRERYHAVILAFGAQSNRRLGVPGEELSGVHPASVFVGWYNGHPDCVETVYDLSEERAIVVGTGNVAVDVARVLLKPYEDLARTDISDVALRALKGKTIREVVLLGRQSHAQAAYTSPELQELTEIPDCDLVVAPEDRKLDPVTEGYLTKGELDKIDPRVRRNMKVLEERALTEPRPGRKVCRLRFYSAPVAVLGDERVRGLRVERTRLEPGEGGGRLKIVPTGETEEISCGLVFRSIGYRVVPFAGVPYDEATSSVPHLKGQVLETTGGAPARGLFVTGWAKRGPSGVIGTNKPDASETVATLVAAHARHELAEPAFEAPQGDVLTLLEERRVQYVSFSDWKLLDQLEVESGRAQDRPRRKFTDVASMLQALGLAKMGALPHEKVVASKG